MRLLTVVLTRALFVLFVALFRSVPFRSVPLSAAGPLGRPSLDSTGITSLSRDGQDEPLH